MIDTYWYLATVYRKHALGLDAAAECAAKIAAMFIDARVSVFAPIPHGHAIARHSETPANAQFWAELQIHYMRPAHGLIVVEMDGWLESQGIQGELKFFRAMRRPIIHVSQRDPVTDFMIITGGGDEGQ